MGSWGGVAGGRIELWRSRVPCLNFGSGAKDAKPGFPLDLDELAHIEYGIVDPDIGPIFNGVCAQITAACQMVLR